jgi:hypothetical protein
LNLEPLDVARGNISRIAPLQLLLGLQFVNGLLVIALGLLELAFSFLDIRLEAKTCLPSGRDFTYRPVQKSGATSQFKEPRCAEPRIRRSLVTIGQSPNRVPSPQTSVRASQEGRPMGGGPGPF